MPEQTKPPESQELKEEQEKRDREKRFFEDPYSFIEIKELIVGAVVMDEGRVATLVNPANRTQYEIVQSRLNFRINEAIMRMEVEAYKQRKIVLPGQKRTSGAFGNPFRKRG